jgi:N-acetylmuramoyl-L-alanine amidase CwlA
MSFPITSSLIAGLPKNPYRGGVGAYEGVVCHATDNYNDTALNERNYEAGHWNNAFVHFFVDDTSIIQVADTNYVAWGCANGNPRYVQIELCQSQDATKFNNAYARYVWLIAKLLFDKGLGVTNGKTIVSHDWVSKNLGGTTHSDPIQYLSSHGVSWTQHVTNVMEEYKKMVGGVKMDKNPSDWAKDAWKWGVENGFIDSVSNPHEGATQEIVVNMLYRLFSNKGLK